MTSTPITESDVAQRVREERLSVREKIGYGLVTRAARSLPA